MSRALKLLLLIYQMTSVSWRIEEHQWLCSRMFQKQSTTSLSSLWLLNYSMCLDLIFYALKLLVMLLNSLLIKTRFKHILQPIAAGCISREQSGLVDFDSFFTHTICHECCHGIGPHTITLPNGQKSTVRLVSPLNFTLSYFFSHFLLIVVK